MARRVAEPGKGQKRQRTRARLVEAAAALVRERGFEQVSLEAVAARAGMTRGAIYGNFRDKDELLLAVVSARWEPIVPQFDPAASFSAHMMALAEAVIDAMPARGAVAVAAASFQVYALTHPDMRARIAAANAETYRRMVESLRATVAEESLPISADELVRVLHALIDGLMFLHALTPEFVGAETVRAAFALLLNCTK